MFFRRLWFSVVAIASLWLLLGVLVPVSSSIQQRSRMSADQSRSLTSSAPPPPSAAAAVLSSSWSSSLTKKQNNNNNPVRKNQYSKNKSPKNNNNKMVARQNSKLECHPSQESIWLMNQCHHGYVAVLPDRRVVSLDANEPNNKLGKKKKFFTVNLFFYKKNREKKSIAKPCASFNGDDNNFFEKFISFKILQSVRNLFHPYVVSCPGLAAFVCYK